MRYRVKPKEFEAFQFDGDLIGTDGEYYIPEWAIKAVKDKLISYSDYIKGSLKVKCNGINMFAKIGDYVILEPNGQLSVCNKRKFEQMYEPAPKKDLKAQINIHIDSNKIINKLEERMNKTLRGR